MKTYRAGVIPYYIKDGETRMMFMKPSDPKYGGDSYQVAKGKVEEDETDRQAAFREANEELGLVASNVILAEELGVFLGRTTMFIAKIVDPELFDEFHFETGSVIWMTPKEFQSDGRELHKQMVRSAARTIREVEEKQKELDKEFGDMDNDT